MVFKYLPNIPNEKLHLLFTKFNSDKKSRNSVTYYVHDPKCTTHNLETFFKKDVDLASTHYNKIILLQGNGLIVAMFDHPLNFQFLAQRIFCILQFDIIMLKECNLLDIYLVSLAFSKYSKYSILRIEGTWKTYFVVISDQGF